MLLAFLVSQNNIDLTIPLYNYNATSTDSMMALGSPLKVAELIKIIGYIDRGPRIKNEGILQGEITVG